MSTKRSTALGACRRATPCCKVETSPSRSWRRRPARWPTIPTARTRCGSESCGTPRPRLADRCRRIAPARCQTRPVYRGAFASLALLGDEHLSGVRLSVDLELVHVDARGHLSRRADRGTVPE